MTGSGLSNFEIAKSADDIRVVELVVVLLPVAGSGSLADTVAQLVSVLEAVGSTITTIVMVALLPLAIKAKLHVIVVVPLQPGP